MNTEIVQALDHFADVGKTIQMPKGAEKEIPDIMREPSIVHQPDAQLPEKWINHFPDPGKMVEPRLTSEEKKSLKNPHGLPSKGIQ